MSRERKTKRVAQAVLLASVLAAVALVVWGERMLVGGTQVAATGPGQQIGIDADPTGNTATSVGAIEDCIQVANDATFEVDIYVKGIPGDDGMTGFELNLEFTDTLLSVQSYDHAYMVEATPGCGDYYGNNDPVPATESPWHADHADLNGSGCHENGDGVLSRITMKAAASGSGLATLSTSDPYAIVPHGLVYTEDFPDGIAFNTVTTAQIAVGEACPMPVGGVAELPEVPHSAARNYTALAALAAATLVALTAGAWCARRRFSRG